MTEHTIVNGVDVTELKKKAGALQQDPELAAFHFHMTNKWLGIGHSRNTIESFGGLKQELVHDNPFHVEADEPHELLSGDEAPNPVEIQLAALGSCLTGALVYHAAVRGLALEEVESTIEGDIDLRGFMGLSEDVRKGYQNITVTFRVKSDATTEELKECASFSPVFDVTCNGTNVDLVIEKT
jgi:uncharacterized OsmC-like protein